jgi:hypothetical protein
MIGRPRYGIVGIVGMPYFVLFEALGPLIETLGYAVAIVSLALGLLNASLAAMLLVLSLSYGLVLSFGALIVEEHAFRRYRSWRCVGRMVVAAIVENFGYRQVGNFVRAWAFVTLLRRPANRWGEMQRAGFEPAPAPTP